MQFSSPRRLLKQILFVFYDFLILPEFVLNFTHHLLLI